MSFTRVYIGVVHAEYVSKEPNRHIGCAINQHGWVRKRNFLSAYCKVSGSYRKNVSIISTPTLTYERYYNALYGRLIRLYFRKKRILPKPEPPIISTFLLRACLGGFGLLLSVKPSVTVSTILFLGLGSTKGTMSFTLPYGVFEK